MTRQKAILQLENLKEHCNEMKWKSDVIALNIAIDSLKMEKGAIIYAEILSKLS